MKSAKSTRQSIQSVLSVVLGNFLLALTIKLFLIPGDLVTGGTTGLALLAEHFWGVPMSLFVLIFNVIMLLFGLAVLGKSFAATTVLSSFLYPLFLELCDRVLGDLVLTNDLLLCTVFSGLGVGIALGIVIRSGSSTGGMDIPPLVLQKLFRIPVSVGMYGFDFAIILAQILFRPVESILYGVVLAIIYTIVLDKMMLIGQDRIEVKIVSRHSRQISDEILRQVDRGVTLLHGEGGYLGQQTNVVMSVVSSRELVKVEKIVHRIDPECFMVINRVSEVRGRGFSLTKDYQSGSDNLPAEG